MAIDQNERNAKFLKRQEEARRQELELKERLLKETGLANHPKADRLWDLAWDRGHSAGFYEVEAEFRELATLLLPD